MGRPPWVEWEGKTPAALDLGHDLHVLTVLGHPDSAEELRTSLVPELAQTGIAAALGEAWAMATTAVLTYGWFGYVGEGTEPVWCTGSGETAEEDQVDRAMPCVYAAVYR